MADRKHRDNYLGTSPPNFYSPQRPLRPILIPAMLILTCPGHSVMGSANIRSFQNAKPNALWWTGGQTTQDVPSHCGDIPFLDFSIPIPDVLGFRPIISFKKKRKSKRRRKRKKRKERRRRKRKRRRIRRKRRKRKNIDATRTRMTRALPPRPPPPPQEKNESVILISSNVLRWYPSSLPLPIML